MPAPPAGQLRGFPSESQAACRRDVHTAPEQVTAPRLLGMVGAQTLPWRAAPQLLRNDDTERPNCSVPPAVGSLWVHDDKTS